MGLYIITGTMGGGKSYFAADLAYNCWQDGGVVHTNMPWRMDELERLGFADRHIELPEDHEKWVRTEQGPDGKERVASDVLIGGTEGHENLIIIDEAALQLSAMDQALTRQKNKTLFRLVVMSRQLGIDMYFITQSATNIDVFIRNVAESVIHCQNVTKIPGVGAILALFVGEFRRSWLSPLQRKVIMTKYARFNSLIGGLYKTDGEGAKMNIKRSEHLRKKKKGNWSFKYAFAILSVLTVTGYLAYYFATGKWSIPGLTSPVSQALPGVIPPTRTEAEEKRKAEIPTRLVMRSSDNSAVLDSKGHLYQMNGGLPSYRISNASDNGSVLTLHLIGGRTVELPYD